MPVRRLAEMTWEEFRDLTAEGVVAILPVGAIEAHGPHLPLATDVVIAESMAEAGARRLAADGLEPVLLPALAYTRAGFAAEFPGTVNVRGSLVRGLVRDVARSLARHGVELLALANAHLDPAHVASLWAAVEEIAGDGTLAVAFPDITRRRWAERLTDEFRSGACHAGRFEGSVVLAARPEWVRDGVAADLPPNPASLVDAIREGKTGFREAGGPRAYFGYPAEARSEEGERTIETLGEILAESVREALA